MEPIPSPRPSRFEPGLGCVTGALFGLQLLLLFVASALGDGLLGMIGGLTLCVPLCLALVVTAVLAFRQKRWVLAAVALLMASPMLLFFRLFF